MTRQWAELGAVAIGLSVCMHVRRLLVAGLYSDGARVASTGQDGRTEGQMGFHLMGRAEDICTACTPALLTKPSHTYRHPPTHTRTLFPSLASHRRHTRRS